jgi:phosphoenolpyruvate synthase/pyruvate phosphate dikinase
MLNAACQRYVIPMTAAATLDADRVGPKAANLATVGRRGLPIPDGFCIDSDAYRMQLVALGVDLSIPKGTNDTDIMRARRGAIEVRLALLTGPIVAEVLEPLLTAWPPPRCLRIASVQALRGSLRAI